MSSASLMDLPDELLLMVFSDLSSFEDIKNVSLVNKRCNTVLHTQSLWSKHFGNWLPVDQREEANVRTKVKTLLPAAKTLSTDPYQIEEISKVHHIVLRDYQAFNNVVPDDTIQELTLVNVGLEYLPPEIGQLKNLRVLNLTHNHLKSLPKEIGNCTNIEQLWLGHNSLETLPESLAELKNVKVFHANNNHLTNISFSLRGWNQIEEFWVQCNPITQIPASLKRLEQAPAPYSEGLALEKDCWTDFTLMVCRV